MNVFLLTKQAQKLIGEASRNESEPGGKFGTFMFAFPFHVENRKEQSSALIYDVNVMFEQVSKGRDPRMRLGKKNKEGKMPVFKVSAVWMFPFPNNCKSTI